MTRVEIKLGGRSYALSCEDGQEARVRELAEQVDSRMSQIAGARGSAGEAHLLALTAVMLADEADTARREAESARADAGTRDGAEGTEAGAAAAPAAGMSREDEELVLAAVEHLTHRIDTLADHLAASSDAPDDEAQPAAGNGAASAH